LKNIRIIINADDLGGSHEINKATFDLVDRGIVTSASIIANGPDVEEACQQVKAHPDCSYGVHLNLTEFAPLTGSVNLDPLLNRDGHFDGEIIRQIPVDQDLAVGIYIEFCAQIERLVSLGVDIGHIDSHLHIHTIPKIFRILKKVQRKFEIRKARLSRNIYAPNERTSLALKIKKGGFNTMLRRYYRTKTTDGFSDFLSFYASAEHHGNNMGTVEVMIHPGNHHYSNEETDLIQTPWQEILNRPVELISYSSL